MNDIYQAPGTSRFRIAGMILLLILVFSHTSTANTSPDLSSLIFIPVPLPETETLSEVLPTSALLPEKTADKSRNNTASPETDSARELMAEASIEQYLQSIASLENTQGLYSPEISEASLALAALYRATGNQEAALAAYDKAFHITRINNGLFDLSQTEILRGMIDSYVALDQLEKAHEKQEYLFYVQLKNFAGDDPELLPAMIEWADWNINLYLQVKSYGTEGIGNLVEDIRGRQWISNPLLLQAQSLYYSVIDLIMENSGLNDPRLITTERKLAALNYMVNQEINSQFVYAIPASMSEGQTNSPAARKMDPANSAHFYNGSDALKRAIAYSYNVQNPEYGTIAERIMELGDWYLLFDRRAAALEIYEEAFALLNASPMSEEEIENIMSPGMPVRIPEVYSQAAVKPETSQYKGYIDVEFTLSKFGIASRPEIISASAENTREIEKELVKTIRNCKFRPRFVAGSATSKEKVQLRYYYIY